MVNETTLQSMTERLQLKCDKQFGDGITLGECYEFLRVIFNLEHTGASNCFPETGPLIEHNAEYFTFCSSFDHLINKFILPILILFCYANVFTLLIYRLPYFDGSCSVNFLRVKAMANFIFVQSRIFEAIHAWTYEPNGAFEQVYWSTKPLVITIANVSGTVSTWLTLLVTVETLLCVMLPFNFRQLCTRKTTTISLFVCIFTSVLLHTTFFLTHTVKPIISIKWLNESRHFINPYNTPVSNNSTNLTFTPDLTQTCWYVYKYYSMNLSQLPFYELLEKLYYWSQTIFSIIFPTIAMLICSVLIVVKFTFKELGEAFSQRRKCVIRLTIATTLSHLLFEGPALLTFGAAAIKGAESDEHSQTMCFLNHVNNLLSIINATIPFFVFLACNEQFRHMSTIYLKAQTELRREKRAALLAVALNQRSRVGGSQADRSFAGQMLIGKVSNL